MRRDGSMERYHAVERAAKHPQAEGCATSYLWFAVSESSECLRLNL